MRIAVVAALVAAASAQQGYINYTTVTGYFLQDLTSTNTSGFEYTAVNFGLINQTYPGVSSSGLTQWQQFKQVVDDLNDDSPEDTAYKVLWLGRHGEGYHNAAESFYGTPAWNCYWSELDGNATATWADADLTPNGIKQAQIANAFWKYEIANQKIPRPQSYYTSPLTRCLRTANLTFSDIPTLKYYPFVPEVKEFFREGISTHTCDRRSNKTYIHNRFPTYTFEAGFTETDELWNANYAETSSAQDKRSKSALDSVFSANDHTWISVTSHSGEIASILRVLGHRTFSLSTGAVIPVLVKAQFLPIASAPAVSSAPARTSSAFCSALPVTSISGGACVCPGPASTGLVSSTVRSGSASASSGAVVSRSGSASSRVPIITGTASPSKSGLQPSASSTKKPKVCKSRSKSKAAASTSKAKACKSRSKSKTASASTGAVSKPSRSASISAGRSTSMPSASIVRSTSASSASAIKSSSAPSASVVKSTAAPSASIVKSSTTASTKKPKACKSRSKGKTASASTGAVSKPTVSASVSAGKTTSVPSASSAKTTSAPSASIVKTSSLTTSVVKSSSSANAKTSSISTSCTGKASASSSSVATGKSSTSSAAVVKSSSTSAVKLSGSTAGTVSTSASAVSVRSSSSASTTAKPSSTAPVSSKTLSASSGKTTAPVTTSVPRVSQTALSSKTKACKSKTYPSYYNEYTP